MNCYFDKLLKLKDMGGDIAKLYDAVQKGKDSMVFSLSKSHRAHIISHLDKFVLYIAKDSVDARNAFDYLNDYYGEQLSILNGSDDLLIYHKAFSQSGVGGRIRALSDILNGKTSCCIATVQALMQYCPLPERLQSNVVTIAGGQTMDIYQLVDSLTKMGYERRDVIEEKNTFSVAGDIISIFPADYDMPIRLSFYGDIVESIKLFDPDSRITLGTKDRVIILPDNALLFSDEEIASAMESARKEAEKLKVSSETRATEILNDLAMLDGCRGQHQWLLPFMVKNMGTICDYIPEDCVIVADEPTTIVEQFDLYESEHQARVKVLAQDGDVLKSHAKAINSASKVIKLLHARGSFLGFSNITSSNSMFSPKEIFNIKSSNLNAYTLSYEALYDDLRHFVNAGFMTVICQGDMHKATALADSLNKDDIPCAYMRDIAEFRHGITVTPIELSHGFVYPQNKLAVIGMSDITRSRQAKANSKNKVFTMPKVGDYVVHEVHGIGRCLGTKRVKTGTIEQDYVVVEYRNGGMLYVPIDQMDRLCRYSGSDVAPKLSIIGGKDFERIKDNVKHSVKAMAINLVELYSARQKKIGHKYQEDTIWQKEFEKSFEFEETPDQLDAIQDIKSDMERGVVMDRLLCGDVGYGKTEVALRAVFKTIMENKQAVILAPTTILARQHYNTALSRFNDFKINVELITRFQTQQQINQSLNNLATGKSLVAISTHRILSSDVQFNDLGLLVLDEEQRFGVEHKEKLKTIRNNINVLSMSATPIPRTLNMSMTGIRDISILETPPRNRLPVQTMVTELTPGLLQDAIGRELSRGGQVFILYNRVAKIDAFAEKLRQLVPEAKIIVGHGQMDSADLEDKINSFYNKEANVLVCTTIIENGIDIPDANTLVVCDADRLGLSQLYQLRGRVGRSNRVAYAYFTTEEGRVLTGNAAKRLVAIMDYTELGSGFKIAMRDLEIRGAGNILGREQHGHIEKVGYEMYCRLLKECVDDLRGIEKEVKNDIQVTIDIDAYLDSSYVVDDNMRLRIFREIIDIDSEEQRNAFLNNLAETYGKPPDALVNLVDIGLMKNIAGNLGVSKIRITAKGAGFVFKDSSCYKNESLVSVISEFGEKCLLTNDTEPCLIFDCKYLMNIQKLRLLKEFLLKTTKSF